MRRFAVVMAGAVVATASMAVAGTAGAAHTPKPPVSTVTSVSPDHGPTTGGTMVKIKGKNLVTASAVTFGGVAATFEIDGHAVLATSPGGTGTVEVQVTTSDGTTALNPPADDFTYETDTPTISKVAPGSGTANGGTKVTIGGANLTGAYEVDFGTTPSPSVTAESDHAVVAVTPPGSVGEVPVTVITPSGSSPSDPAAHFTYRLVAPKVTSVSPDSGTAGTQVTIQGQRFSKATAVDFGGVGATFTINSGRSITATVPAGSGTVTVTVTDANGTSVADPPATNFTYTG